VLRSRVALRWRRKRHSFILTEASRRRFAPGTPYRVHRTRRRRRHLRSPLVVAIGAFCRAVRQRRQRSSRPERWEEAVFLRGFGQRPEDRSRPIRTGVPLDPNRRQDVSVLQTERNSHQCRLRARQATEQDECVALLGSTCARASLPPRRHFARCRWSRWIPNRAGVAKASNCTYLWVKRL
jgi:hypothetical protein